MTEQDEKKLADIRKVMADAQNRYCKIDHAEYCRDVGYLLKLVERLRNPDKEEQHGVG